LASCALGSTGNGGTFFNGSLADWSFWNRALTTLEIQELELGPEPYFVTVPTEDGDEEVGSNLTCTPGTVSDPDNGVVSFQYQWYRADDANGLNEARINGETSAVIGLVSADSGKFLRCRCTPVNLGGYDWKEQTFTAYTGAIQGGAPSGFETYWAGQATQAISNAVAI
jgi:hypothetical protein